jgi:cytochrome c biogenesis protein CcmG, thiol:disulfide interchange protein DsbE
MPRRAGLSGGLLTVIFVAAIAVGVLASGLGGAPDRAEVGSTAPPLTVTGFDGTPFNLQAHVDGGGGPVLLNLWASWCEPCRREFPALSAFAAMNPGVTVVGVAVRDQLDDARAFAFEMQPSFLVAFDEGDLVNESYPVFSLPGTFIVDRNGVITDFVIGELTPARLSAIDFDR